MWTEQAKLLPADAAAPFDEFGNAVAVEGDRAVIGAHQDDDNGEDSGSAYVFRLSQDDVVPAAGDFGTGLLLLAMLGTGVYFVRRRATS